MSSSPDRSSSDRSSPDRSSPRESFIFLGSGVLLLVALLLGFAREKHWGTRFALLHFVSNNAAGLRAGQEVRISGLPVGQLRSLEFRPDASVAVQLQVEERYAPLIGPKSIASVGQEGFVGDHYLVISPDPQPRGSKAQADGRLLRFEPPLDLANLMKSLVSTQAELNHTLRNTTKLTGSALPASLQEVNRSLKGINKITGSTLPASLLEVNRSLKGFNQLTGTLDRETATTAPQLRQTLQQASRTGSSAEVTSRQAQRLLEQSQPLILETLAEVKKLSSTSRRLLRTLVTLTGSAGLIEPSEPSEPSEQSSPPVPPPAKSPGKSPAN